LHVIPKVIPPGHLARACMHSKEHLSVEMYSC
jgi:hypothetical protein